MNDPIDKESCIHGSQWDQFHAGYFASVDVARPHVDAICEAQAKSQPDLIVDLGGGTGFVLDQLAQRLPSETRLVNLDCSDAQLDTASQRHIDCVHASIADFSREVIANDSTRVLWIMRSALHYFGQEGLVPALRHLREQACEGEVFVHQTASFDNATDADGLNMLYKRMRTEKWYPTVSALEGALSETGWTLQEVIPAAPLPLTSRDLALRYDLSDADVTNIRTDLNKRFGETKGVLESRADGFCAYLHYNVYCCTARGIT